MAHNNDYTDDNFTANDASHCVDERRVHVPVLTGSLAFEEFDHWIDVALEGLVERWIHTASPRAAQTRFWGKRFESR
jgi:hypothetical protein